jgi:tetratricopeptide (TPR) repeat protein
MDARCSMRAWLRCSVVFLGLTLIVTPHARGAGTDALREAAARLVEEGEYRKAARLLDAIRIADPADASVYVHLATARAGLRQYRATAGAVRIGIERAAEKGDSASLENLLEHQRLAVESLLGHARTVLSRIEPAERSRLIVRMDSVLVLPSRAEMLLPDTTRFFPDGMANLDVDEAIECFRLATQMNPEAAKPFALVAFEYVREERWTEARRVLNEGVKRVPGDRDLGRLLGQTNRKVKGGYAY